MTEISDSHVPPPSDEKPECYVPKMKPGDVEIPNRVFVKGFPKDDVVDNLFTFFETYGKVLECRIVADKYGCSKGFGFVTFDSQNVAESVKELERIKYKDDIELVIGPARIRKKRYYLLPAHSYQQPQPYYASDGSIVWATPAIPTQPQMQAAQPQPISAIPMNATAQPQPATYGPPVMVSVMNEPTQFEYHHHQQHPQCQQQCVVYQTAGTYQPDGVSQVPMHQSNNVKTIYMSPQGMMEQKVTMMEQKHPVQGNMSASQVCIDDQQVPCMSPVSSGYVEVQSAYNMSGDTIVYSPMVPLIPKMQTMHIQ